MNHSQTGLLTIVQMHSLFFHVRFCSNYPRLLPSRGLSVFLRTHLLGYLPPRPQKKIHCSFPAHSCYTESNKSNTNKGSYLVYYIDCFSLAQRPSKSSGTKVWRQTKGFYETGPRHMSINTIDLDKVSPAHGHLPRARPTAWHTVGAQLLTERMIHNTRS